MGIITCHRKPVNVQGWQIPEFDVEHDDEWKAIVKWCHGHASPPREFPYKTPAFILVGKEHRVPAFVGDWVIRDSSPHSTDSFYVIPDNLFRQSFDIVQDVVLKYSAPLREDLSYLENPPFTITLDGPSRWSDDSL